jgi:hypothetical protein
MGWVTKRHHLQEPTRRLARRFSPSAETPKRWCLHICTRMQQCHPLIATASVPKYIYRHSISVASSPRDDGAPLLPRGFGALDALLTLAKPVLGTDADEEAACKPQQIIKNRPVVDAVLLLLLGLAVP